MLFQSINVRKMQRYKEFAKRDNQPQIHSNIISARIPDAPDTIYTYWKQRKMTSSGDPLN